RGGWRLLELAGIDGVHDGAGIAELDAVADARRTADPAGVHEPDLRAMLLQFRAEELGVFFRMPDEEGTAEAGGEGGFGARDADFGAGDFGGVAAEKVILGLLESQLADGGQNSKGVAGEEDHIVRVA